MFAETMDMFLLPAITYATKYTSPCKDWLVVFSFWVARVCSLPLYHIPYFGAEYIFVFRLKQYHRYVVKSILTDAALTLWGFG
jgi:hypothetical protein